MRISGGNRRRRVRLTNRDVKNKVIEAVMMALIVFFCTSLFLTSLADHACGPAAHAAPTVDVVQRSPSLLTPIEQRQASEQAGQLAAFYRENF